MTRKNPMFSPLVDLQALCNQEVKANADYPTEQWKSPNTDLICKDGILFILFDLVGFQVFKEISVKYLANNSANERETSVVTQREKIQTLQNYHGKVHTQTTVTT